MRRGFVLGIMCAAPLANAESLEPGSGERAAPTSNRINFRLGGATTDDTGRPTICLDVRVIAGFGIESCGTGQAILHNDPGREMAHFRATWAFFERTTPHGVGKLRAGAGFAELQVGVDHPGFNFGDPDARDRGSVAGPEAVVQGQWLVPLGVGVEAVASMTAGVAAFAEADKLVVPSDSVQPFVSFEIGVGW
ncbi:MAG: hypothetical protein H0X17_15060 [Deltaproteobacteria bacterium]|nr:hypothetical protein [Deltaproteobacteria bacterium]